MPRTDDSTLPRPFRDFLSGLTHALGALLATAGLVALCLRASNPVLPWHLPAYAIFGLSMILLYTASALYHWLPLQGPGLERMRKLDHMMIFILIAGTYTPFCLVPLRGPWGWSILATVWGTALFGIGFKLFWLHAPRWLYTALYVAMGWIALAGIVPLVRTLPAPALLGLFGGGVFYTSGAVIYALKKPDPIPGFFGFHEIFHILVLLGTASHFWAIYRYVSELS